MEKIRLLMPELRPVSRPQPDSIFAGSIRAGVAPLHNPGDTVAGTAQLQPRASIHKLLQPGALLQLQALHLGHPLLSLLLRLPQERQPPATLQLRRAEYEM